MKLWLKIVILTIFGLFAGLLGRAYLSGAFVSIPRERTEAVIWAFEKYCLPMAVGIRAAVPRQFFEIGRTVHETIWEIPEVRLTIKRDTGSCRIDDELAAFTPEEVLDLLQKLEELMAAKFEVFETAQPDGAEDWESFRVWEKPEGNEVPKQVIIFASSKWENRSLTFLTFGSEKPIPADRDSFGTKF